MMRRPKPVFEGLIEIEALFVADSLKRLSVSKRTTDTVVSLSKPEKINFLTAVAFMETKYAAVLLHDVREVFQAINVLISWVSEIETGFAGTERQKVLRFESFARFFKKLEASFLDPKDPFSTHYAARISNSKYFKDAKSNVTSWPIILGMKGQRDIKKSQILTFLHFKTLVELFVWGDLTADQSRPILDKLYQLAADPHTHENVKLVLSSDFILKDLQQILADLDQGTFVSQEQKDQLQNALNTIAKTQPSEMGQNSEPISVISGMNTPSSNPFLDEIDEGSTPSKTQTSLQDSPPKSRVAEENTSATETPPANPSIPIVIADPQTDKPQFLDTPDLVAQTKPAETSDPPAPLPQTEMSKQAQPPLTTTAQPDPVVQNTPQPPAPPAAPFEALPAKAETALASTSIYLIASQKLIPNWPGGCFFLAGWDKFKNCSTHRWNTAVSRLRTTQTGIFWKDVRFPSAYPGWDHSTLGRFLDIKLDLGGFSYVQRLDLIITALQSLSDSWGRKWGFDWQSPCPHSPFVCHCKFHGVYAKEFIYSTYALMSGAFVQFTIQCGWKQLLLDIPTCSQNAEYWLMQRILPIINEHVDDLDTRTDALLLDVAGNLDTNQKNAQWHFRAQMLIARIKRGQLQDYNTRSDLIREFLLQYVQLSDFYLNGSNRLDYQAELLACCDTVSQFWPHLELTEVFRVLVDKLIEPRASSLLKAVALWQYAATSGGPQQFYKYLLQEIIKYLISANSSFESFWPDISHEIQLRSKFLLETLLSLCTFEQDWILGNAEWKIAELAFGVLAFCETNSKELGVSTEQTKLRLTDAFTVFTRNITAESLHNLVHKLERKEQAIRFFNAGKQHCTAIDAQILENTFANIETEVSCLRRLNNRLDWLETLVQTHKLQPSDDLKSWKETLRDDKQLTVKEMRSFEQAMLHSIKYVLAAKDLMGLKFYHELLKKHVHDQEMSLIQFDMKCRAVETELREFLNGSALETINEATFNRLDAIFKDESVAKKISEAFQLSNDVTIIQRKYRLIKLFKNFSAFKSGLQEIVLKLDFVTDQKSDIKMLDKLAKEYEKTKSIDFESSDVSRLLSLGSDEHSSIERIAGVLTTSKLAFGQNLANLPALFEEFGTKNETHFQNLLTCKAMQASGLHHTSIKHLEKFIKEYSKGTNRVGLAEFLTCLTTDNRVLPKKSDPAAKNSMQRYNLIEVVIRARSIIMMSKHVTDNIERGSHEMVSILEKSHIRFMTNAATKVVEVSAHYQYFAHDSSTTKPLEEIVTLESLKSTKIQMALFESAKTQSEPTVALDSTENPPAQPSKSSLFIELVNHIEAIQKSLQGLVELGLVYNIEAQLKADCPELPKLVGDYRSASQKPEVELPSSQLHRVMAKNLCCTDYLSLEVMIKAENAGVLPNISQFIILRVLLAHHLQTLKQQLLKPKHMLHEITRLEGHQKVLLCQWIQTKAEGLSDSPTHLQLSRSVSALTKYAFEKDFTVQTMSKSEWSKFTQDKSGQTTAVLESALTTLLEKRSSGLRAPQTTDESLADRSILYFQTKPNHTFKDLLKVLHTHCQRTTFADKPRPALQFFLASAETTASELFLFILRAAQDPQQDFYYMVDLHLVKLEVASQFFDDVQDIFFGKASELKNKNLLLMLSSEFKQNELLVNLMRHRKIRNFELDLLDESRSLKVDLSVAKKLFPGLQLDVVSSESSGMGKSHHIQREVSAASTLATINLSGEMSRKATMRRLAIIDKSLHSKGSKTLSLHFILDMVENFEENCELLDQYLFQLAFLRKFNYGDTVINLKEVDRVFLELQNTCKQVYLEKLSVLSLFQGSHTAFSKFAAVKNLADIASRFDFNNLSPEEEARAQRLTYIMNDLQKFAAYNTGSKKKFGIPWSLPEKTAKVEPTQDEKINEYLSSFCKGATEIPDKKHVFLSRLNEIVESLCKKKIAHTTMSMIVSFINMAYYQLEEFCKVAALDLRYSCTQNMVKLRYDILTKLFSATVDLLWQDSHTLVKETKTTQEYLKALQNKSSGSDQLLREFKESMNNIKEWRDSKMVSYFMLNGVLKPIFCQLDHISGNVRAVITALDPSWAQRQLVDEVITPFKFSRKAQILPSYNPFDPVEPVKPRPNRNRDATTSFFVQLHEVLCPDTTEDAKREQISKFRNGFTFTQDVYVKILMIVQRACQRIPIVIMGPTGCGKTYLVTFTAKCLLGDKFREMTLHPGVTEDKLKEELLKIQVLAKKLKDEAKANYSKPTRRVWMLFDEFNTSHLQSLVSDIMTTRRANFDSELQTLNFEDNIVFVACCNPFKIEPAKYTEVGLLNQSNASLLSHRVYPIPDTLVPFVWRFSGIKDDNEEKHIKLKLDAVNIPLLWKSQEQLQETLVNTARVCHRFHRNHGSENSISLRDLTRFKDIFEFLTTHFFRVNSTLSRTPTEEEEADDQIFTEYDGLIVAAQFCYVLRLESPDLRAKLTNELTQVRGLAEFDTRFDQILKMLKDELSNLASLKELLHKTIFNRPLLENLFALWICIITRIPLLICGKPGTSKTLSVTIINAAFGGCQNRLDSTLRFFNKDWSITPTNFWGTETTTAESVETAFDTAEKTYQSLSKVVVNHNMTRLDTTQMMYYEGRPSWTPRDSMRTSVAQAPEFSDEEEHELFSEYAETPEQDTLHRVPLFFDEIGLAEISKDNPLKVLHSKLEPKKRTISFVGISNWKLDASKQNRVLYLARPDMSVKDLVETCGIRFQHYDEKEGKHSVGRKLPSSNTLQRRLEPYFQLLAEVFVEFRKQEEKSERGHRNFHGSRDFYSVVGILEYAMKDLKEFDEIEALESLTNNDYYYLLIRNAIERSFSGHDDSASPNNLKLLKMFDERLEKHHKGLFGTKEVPNSSCMQMIFQNLLDTQARHLMVFTETSGMQDMLLQSIRDFQINVQGLTESKFVFLSQNKGREEMIKVMMTQLPIYTREGFTVVMKNIEDVYGCMYDLLNKNYTKSDSRKMNQCKLFYENNQQTIDVDDRFKIILLMDRIDVNKDQKELERQLPPPFLNRFEKYYLSNREFMNQAQHEYYLRLRSQCFPDKPNKFVPEMKRLIFNLSDELLVSVVSDFQSKLAVHTPRQPSEQDEPDGLWKQSVVSYLSGCARLVSEEPTPQNVKQPHKPGKPEVVISVEEQAVQRLYPLLNKNMVLAIFLNSSNNALLGFNFENIDEIKQKFLDSHPYDSLQQLVTAMSQPKPVDELCKVVVFTFSTRHDLEDTLKPLTTKDSLRVDLQDAHVLMQQITVTQGEGMVHIVADKRSLLVVSFRDSESCKAMHLLRYWIRKTPGSADKRVIFVVSIGSDHYNPELSHQCPVSYSTAGWRMVSIDNLRGSNYEHFFDLLEKPFSESFKSANREVFGVLPKHELLKQIISESFSKFFFKGLLATEASADISELNLLIETLSNREGILTHFSKLLENKVSETAGGEEPVFYDLLIPLSKANNRSLRSFFQTYQNLDSFVSQHYRQILTEELQNILCEKVKPEKFKNLQKILVLPLEIQNEILQLVEKQFPHPDEQHQQDIWEGVEPLQFQSKLFNLKFRSGVEDLKSRVSNIYQGVGQAKAQFDKQLTDLLRGPGLKEVLKDFSVEVRPTDVMEMDEPTDHASPLTSVKNHFLVAIKSFEKYEKAQASSLSKELLTLLVLSVHKYMIMHTIPLDQFKLTGGMIIISQVFQEDLKCMGIILSNQNSVMTKQLIEQSAHSFETKSTFELEAHLGRFFKLHDLHSSEDLNRLKSSIEIGISLCKRLPKLTASSTQKSANKSTKLLLQHEFLSAVLNWIVSIQDEEKAENLKLVLTRFNLVKNSAQSSSQPDSLTTLLLKFIDGLAIDQGSFPRWQLRRLIDSSLHYCMQLIDADSATSNAEMCCSIYCYQVLNQLFQSTNTCRYLVCLAKLLMKFFSDQQLFDALKNLVEERLKRESEHLFELNCQLVNYTGEILMMQHSGNPSQAKDFLDNGIHQLKQMIENPVEKCLLSRSQIIALRQFKLVVASWEQAAITRQDIDAVEKHTFDEILARFLQTDSSGTDYHFGLLVCQLVYDTLRNTKRHGVSSIGLPKTEDCIDRMLEDSSIELFIPDAKRMKRVVRLRDCHIERLDSTSFEQMVVLLPVISPLHTVDKQKIAVVKCFTKQNGRLGELMSMLTTETEAKSKMTDKKLYNLHLLVGMAALVAELAPKEFIYSRENLKLGMRPIINLESPEIESMLSAMYDKSKNEKNWEKAWKCQSKGCGYITTVRNCGKFGYHLDDKTSFSRCPGPCKKEIGRYSRNGQGEELKEVKYQEMIRIRDELVKEDTKKVKFEDFDPQNHFDEGAYQAKYAADFENSDGCRLAYAVQHCFSLAQKIFDTTAVRPALPLDPNLLQLLSRDFDMVATRLKFDVDSTVTFFIALFDCVLTQLKRDGTKIDDIGKIRKLFATIGTYLDKSRFEIMQKCHAIRSQMCDDQTQRERLKLQAFIKRCYSYKHPNKDYQKLQLLSLWTLQNRQLRNEDFDEYLEKQPQESDAKKMIAKVRMEAEMGILQSIRPLLSAVRDLSNLICKNFSTWFSQDRALKLNPNFGQPQAKNPRRMNIAQPTDMMIMDQTVVESEATVTEIEASPYILTLQSVIDSTYFKHHDQSEKQSAKSKVPTRQKGMLRYQSTKTTVKDTENHGEELGKEFQDKFCKVFQKHMAPFFEEGSAKNEFFKSRLKVECTQAGALMDLIKNLDKAPSTPLVAYTIPNDSNSDPNLKLMRSFIEVFLATQEDLIKNHRDWIPFLPKLANKTKDFSECLDEHFMHFDASICTKDMTDAAYFYLDRNTNQLQLQIDIDWVAEKWASMLFSEAESVTVFPAFKFLDQIPENLASLSQKLQTAHNIQMTTDMSKVGFLDTLLEESDDAMDLEQALVLSLSHIVVGYKDLNPSDMLENLVRADMKKLLPQLLLQKLALEHVEATRLKILLSTFGSVYVQVKDHPELKNKISPKRAPAPQKKSALEQVLHSQDRNKFGLLQDIIDELKLVCAEFINHNNIDQDGVDKLAQESLEQLRASAEKPKMLDELNKYFKITSETSILNLYTAVDQLTAAQEIMRGKASDDETGD